MELIAEVISTELKESLIAGSRYEVHSRFSHGFNLIADNRLAFIGNKEDEILPYGILISKNDVSRLRAWPGEDGLIWNEEGFVSENGCLRTKQARDFSNALPAFSGFTWFEERTLSYPELHEKKTGFGESILLASDQWDDRKDALFNAVVEGENLSATLSKWLGAGPGLTPSGDDFLTGILAADALSPISCKEFKEEIRLMLEKGYTTDIARHQLLCALDGLFSGSWIGFLSAYERREEEEMKKNFYRILSYGHTSGSDMFAGFCMGVKIGRKKAVMTSGKHLDRRHEK
jgi:hypothetical protein